jgi:hypothetical protein
VNVWPVKWLFCASSFQVPFHGLSAAKAVPAMPASSEQMINVVLMM